MTALILILCLLAFVLVLPLKVTLLILVLCFVAWIVAPGMRA